MKLTLTMPLHILLLPLLISPFTTAQETNCIELQDPSCEPLETNITAPLSMTGSDALCGGRTYSTTAYTCHADTLLCPIIAGVPELGCGMACYLPYLYECVDGTTLMPLFNLTFASVSGSEVTSTFVPSHTTKTATATGTAAPASTDTTTATSDTTTTTTATSSKHPVVVAPVSSASTMTKTDTSSSMTTKVVTSSKTETKTSTSTGTSTSTTNAPASTTSAAKASSTSKGAAAPLRQNMALGIGAMALGLLV